jgi:hypothetical protein
MEEENSWVEESWRKSDEEERSERHIRTKRLMILIQDVQRWAINPGGRDRKEWWRLMVMKAKLAKKLAFSTNDKWAKRVRKAFRIAGWDWEKVLMEDRESMVYTAMNDITSHCYIGETGRSIRVRADEEIVCAKQQRTRFEKAMWRLGEETWFWLPLVRVGKGKHEVRRRQKEESTMIGEMTPDMNTAKVRWKKSRGRRTRRDRGRKGKRRRGDAIMRGRTRFEAKVVGGGTAKVEGFDIGEILEQIGEDNREVEVVVRWGEDEGRGWKRAETAMIGPEVREMVRKLKKMRIGREQYCKLVMRGRNREDVRKKLQGLVNHKHAWRAHLKTVTMRVLFDYWVVAGDLKVCDMIKVRSILRKYQKGKYILPTMSDITLRIQNTETLKRREMQDMAQRHIVGKEAMSRLGKRYVNENTRVVMTKGTTIEGILSNHYRTSAGYEEVECAGAPWCVGGEHFQARMRDMDGEIGDVGRMASNTVVWDEESETRDDVLRGFAKYAQKVTRMSWRDHSPEMETWWNERAGEITIRTRGRRKCIKEERLGWMWGRYKKQHGTSWGGFKAKVMEELEEFRVAGSNCGIHEDLRRKIIKMAEIRVQRATNIWQAWMGVDHYEGVRMEKWGANRESHRMRLMNALIVCWSPRAVHEKKKALERWEAHGARTVMMDMAGEVLGEGWEMLATGVSGDDQWRMSVTGAEELQDIQAWRDMIEKGLDTRERKEMPRGGGEVTLRVTMGGPQERVDKLITEVDESMRKEQLDDKVSLKKVMRVKGDMIGLTVWPMDKGGKQVYVSCGLVYKERLTNGVVEAKEYISRVEDEDEIMEEMKKDYHGCGLSRIAPWGEESIPPTIAMAKAKAPKEKTRIVNSYAKGPAREAFEVGSESIELGVQADGEGVYRMDTALGHRCERKDSRGKCYNSARCEGKMEA